MKAKLLKKARKKVRIVDTYGNPATKNDKFCAVVTGSGNNRVCHKTSKGASLYINFGNARNRHRQEVLNFAREYTQKPWWNVFS